MTEESPRQNTPPTAMERAAGRLFGGFLVLIGASLWAWGIGLTIAGLREAAGWPPGMTGLLTPVFLTALLTGIGGWRLFSIEGGNFPGGRLTLAAFGLATMLSALF